MVIELEHYCILDSTLSSQCIISKLALQPSSRQAVPLLIRPIASGCVMPCHVQRIPWSCPHCCISFAIKWVPWLDAMICGMPRQWIKYKPLDNHGSWNSAKGKENPQNTCVFMLKWITAPPRSSVWSPFHQVAVWCLQGMCDNRSQQWFLLLAGCLFGHGCS